jgi:hypothetical protein
MPSEARGATATPLSVAAIVSGTTTATATATATAAAGSWTPRLSVFVLAFLTVLMLTLDGDDVAFITGANTRSSLKHGKVSSTVSDYGTSSANLLLHNPRSPISAEDDDLVSADEGQQSTGNDRFQNDSKDLTALSEEERKKFSFQATVHNYDHSTFKEPKQTPSGWWPNDEWMRWCADPRKRSQFRPFSSRKKWEGYRLGDCIKMCSGCPTTDDFPHMAHWTLAGEYYDLGCDPEGPQYHIKRGNETLLDEIIERRTGKPGFKKPPPKAMVIHLRLGDKMEDASASLEEMIRDGADPGHRSFQGLHAIKSIYEFLTNIAESGLSRVIIRGGSQLPNRYKVSKHYAYCLKLATAKAGYNVTMNLEEADADADFYFMVHAKHIIVSVGGFSRYIGHSVVRRGGILYGRYFR